MGQAQSVERPGRPADLVGWGLARLAAHAADQHGGGAVNGSERCLVHPPTQKKTGGRRSSRRRRRAWRSRMDVEEEIRAAEEEIRAAVAGSGEDDARDDDFEAADGTPARGERER